MKTLSLALAVLTFSFAAVAHSQIQKSGDAYLLRMMWKKGDVYKYNLALKMQAANNQPMNLKSNFTLKVISIDKGVAEAQVDSTDPQTGKPVTRKMKWDSMGQVGEAGGVGSIGGQRMPEKAIKFGESWSISRTVTRGGVSTDVKTTYTLKSIKLFSGIQCAMIDVKAITSKGMNSETTGTMYLEMKTGQIQQLDLLTTTTTGTGLNVQAITNTTTLKRTK